MGFYSTFRYRIHNWFLTLFCVCIFIFLIKLICDLKLKFDSICRWLFYHWWKFHLFILLELAHWFIQLLFIFFEIRDFLIENFHFIRIFLESSIFKRKEIEQSLLFVGIDLLRNFLLLILRFGNISFWKIRNIRFGIALFKLSQISSYWFLKFLFFGIITHPILIEFNPFRFSFSN